MKKVQVVLVLLFLVSSMYCQNFSGIVKDAQGTAISGVKVEMVEDSKFTTTDNNGNWSITAKDNNTKTLVFGKIGYAYEQLIKQSEASNINVVLRTAISSTASVREQQYINQGCNSIVIPNSNEWNADFYHTDLKGDLAPNKAFTRRDPSAVLKINGVYYVWYSYSLTRTSSVATNKQAPWDLNDIYYATSTDGITWTEKGMAVGRGAAGSFDNRSVFTTEILENNGTYYLVYQAAADLDGIYNRNTVCMSTASSPDGPWTKLGAPVLYPTYTENIFFDNNAVHDPCIVPYNGKFYLYYKGECNCRSNSGCTTWCNPICSSATNKQVKWGVAIADSPTGPYVKSEYNPITNTGHEVMVWPYRSGMAILQHQDGPEAQSIQYSEDGINFVMKGKVSNIPEAAGLYRTTLSETQPHRGIEWGLGHVLNWGGGTAQGWMYIKRFDLTGGLPSSVDDRPSFDINIFPNPSEETMTIKGFDGSFQIDVVSLEGIKVISKECSGTEVIDVSHLQKALYIVSVRQGSIQKSYKLLLGKDK